MPLLSLNGFYCSVVCVEVCSRHGPPSFPGRFWWAKQAVLCLLLLILSSSGWAQSVSAGRTYYRSAITGWGACSGCHILDTAADGDASSNAYPAHLTASNNPTFISNAMTPAASAPLGAMYRQFAVYPAAGPAIPSGSNLFLLALYIGQFVAPNFTVNNGNGALALSVRSGVAGTKDLFPLLATDGTSGVASDSGLTKTNGSNGVVSVSQVGASITMQYNATYTSTSGYTGADSFTVSVANPVGTATRTVAVTVLGITSATTATGFKGQAYSSGSPLYQVTSNDGSASNFTATGLPTGLSIDSTNGKITGTPTTTGQFSVTLGVTINGSVNNGVVNKMLTLDIAGVTSASSVNYTQNSAISTYQITSYPASPSAYSLTGSLPSGLAFNASNGQISGTPTVSGTANVTVGATTSSGAVSQALSINVASAGVPVVSTSPTLSVSPTISVIGTVGAAITPIQLSGTNPPVSSYGVTGSLPGGLTMDGSGQISGTPTQSGDYPVTLTATNASGAGSLAVILRVNANAAPVINSAATASATQGASGIVYSITTTGTNGPVTAYSVQSGSLPAGLTLNTSTGVVSGTPTASGVFILTFGATNSGNQTGNLAVTITVAPNAAPVISSPTNGASQVVSVGASVSIAITASNPPLTSFALSGTLPSGLNFNTSTGVISGTPSAPMASTALTLTASNAAGTSAAVTLNLSVGTPAPSACTLSVNEGSSATLDLKACMFPSLNPTGFAIASQPGHGTVSVAGVNATYSPAAGFSGTDTFSATAFFSGGSQSTAGTVTVTVSRRADPTTDPTVKSLVTTQTQALNVAGQVQRQNIGGHLANVRDSRNRGGGAPSPGISWRDAAIPIQLRSEAPPPAMAETGASALPLTGKAPALPLSAGLGAVASASGIAHNPIYQVLSTVAKSQSVDLATLAKALDANAGAAPASGDTKVWVEGVAYFGTRDATGAEKSAEFRSTGLTIGLDLAVSEKLIVGVGIGYARDTATIGTDGSGSETIGNSVAGYASYSVTPQVFVEGVLGIGSYGFDNKRYVSAASSFADSNRRGNQLFGSIGGGYEWRQSGQMLSPYGRLDFSVDRLQQTTEIGAGSYSLMYFDQEMTTLQGVLGLRGETTHRSNFGWVLPRARLEWRQDLQNRSDAAIAYADQVGGTRYSISGAQTQRSALVWGLGSEFLFRDGWAVGLDYQLSRVSDVESAFAVRARLSKILGAKGLAKFSVPEHSEADASDITVDAGVQWDDNVTRAKSGSDVRADTIYNVTISQSSQYFLSGNTRFILNASVGGERFQTFNGLSRLQVGAEGQYQYRGSAEFDAPTWALFAKLQGEEYLGSMRDGYKLTGGVSYARSLTDRLALFSSLAYSSRYANSEVFRTSDVAWRANFDYSLHEGGALYWGLEWRDGDFVSSGVQSLEAITVAKAVARDEAFVGGNVFSYRVAGQSWLANLGYNLSLGPKDSLDLSWRWVESTPTLRPAWVTSPRSYVTNQIMANYLMRF